MKKLLLTLAFLFVPSIAWAQCTGVFPPNTVCGNFTGSPAPPQPQIGVTGVVSAGTAGQAAWYPSNGAAVAGTSLGAIPYLITGGTVSRNDAARWNDNATPAPDIGVDCTGVADSTSAIQTWVNAHLNGGRLKFPIGCQVIITSTIAVTDGINVAFSSESIPGQGPGATLIWQGGNGGNACSSSFSSCKYMFDLEHTDHPTFERLAFFANEAGNGWIADANCPDGFLKFDGNPVTHIGTAGHIIQSSFGNNCVNPNFVAINISPTALNNHENYYLYDNLITCSVKAAGLLSHDGVSNGTTTLTAASGPFATNQVGQRIRISHAGGEFDTTITAFVSTTQVILAAPVPWSDTAQTMLLGQGYGIGIRNGANQNAIQQVIYKVITSFCEVGIAQIGGNMSIDQPTGTQDDFGTFIGSFTAQNTYVDFGAAESNITDIYVGSGVTTPVSISHMRWSNGFQSAVGYVAIGSQVRITDSFPDFGPQSANSNFITPSFTYKVNSIGTVVGGSSYTAGTYTNVPMLFTTGVSGVGNDYGVKATVVVAGGAVTTVTITTPGTFINFPLPVASGFAAGGNIVTWSLTAASSAIGGTGSGFSVPVRSIVTNPIAGNVNIFSANNNWSVGNWTYSQIGFPSFSNNSRIFSINDTWDDVTNIASNITTCASNHATISGPDTCNVITNSVTAGIGMDVVTHAFTTGNGPVIGYRNEGDFTGANNTSFTGFQAIPTTGRMKLYQAGFENAAAVIDLSNGPTANYGFIARAMTSYAGGTLPNAYGFYAEAQKITNVTTGYGFYSAGINDLNYFAGPVITAPTVVGSLPTCAAGIQGARMFVTDQATAIAYHGAVTGSGAFKQGVTCDGTAWYQD